MVNHSWLAAARSLQCTGGILLRTDEAALRLSATPYSYQKTAKLTNEKKDHPSSIRGVLRETQVFRKSSEGLRVNIWHTVSYLEDWQYAHLGS